MADDLPRIADTDEQRKAEWEKANPKSDLLYENFVKQRNMKRQLERPVAEEEKRIKRAEQAKDNDGKLFWDKVGEDIHALSGSASSSMYEWSHIMINICKHCANLGKALWYDPIDFTHFVPYRDEIGAVMGQVKDIVADNAYDYVYAPVKNTLIPQDESGLPTLGFTAYFDDQGKLDVGVTKNGEPDLDQKIRSHVATGVVLWAQIHGYEYDPATQTLKDDAGNLMTNEKLNELNADPETSCLKFLSCKFEMPLTHSMAP